MSLIAFRAYLKFTARISLSSSIHIKNQSCFKQSTKRGQNDENSQSFLQPKVSQLPKIEYLASRNQSVIQQKNEHPALEKILKFDESREELDNHSDTSCRVLLGSHCPL